ncbi:putative aminoacylase 1 [Paratrimastix pyriformis]|uniref:Aminoacylase 1 n=1 Tax=Paratrimastix pyriformis TaxID=342808 RepID=A0ABQ8UAQ8_9EUKA|nr:putative aminoacylase 1 [Paratrimastix pyriformis]
MEELARFQAYLRINTAQPTPNYSEAVIFFKGLGQSLFPGIPIVEQHGDEPRPFATVPIELRILELIPQKPIGLLAMIQCYPDLPSVYLNSHIDVVPAPAEEWSSPPFEAAILPSGRIVARGTQDMKSVGMQYLEAMAKIRREAIPLGRTVHVTFVPDEEIGGVYGTQPFVKSRTFAAMHIGFGLDEGLATEGPHFDVFTGERVAWWLRFEIKGNSGHGSKLLDDTPSEKMAHLLHSLYTFRDAERAKMRAGTPLGQVTSLNVDWYRGGVTTDGGRTFHVNCVPGKIEFGVDFRIPPSIDPESFKARLMGWMQQAEDAAAAPTPAPALETPAAPTQTTAETPFLQTRTIRVWPLQLNPPINTPLVPVNSPWWDAFMGTAKDMGLDFQPAVFPAATDARHIREHGIPCFGFSPMNLTPSLLHQPDEYLHKDIYLAGVEIYRHLIPRLANAAVPGR